MNQPVSSKILRIGVVGFSRNQFDKAQARSVLSEQYENLKNEFGYVEIVSGYTNSGVPKIAYELAGRFGFRTIGFSARQALKVRCGLYPVDDVRLVGSRFGDESEAFVRYIDRLIRVGGGPQSRHEVELFKQLKPENQTTPNLYEFEVDWFGR